MRSLQSFLISFFSVPTLITYNPSKELSLSSVNNICPMPLIFGLKNCVDSHSCELETQKILIRSLRSFDTKHSFSTDLIVCDQIEENNASVSLVQ